MSDSAFPTGMFPGFTKAQLLDRLAWAVNEPAAPYYVSPETAAKMRAEIARRDAVAGGDVSQMTPGERLRFNSERRKV